MNGVEYQKIEFPSEKIFTDLRKLQLKLIAQFLGIPLRDIPEDLENELS